MLVDGLPTEAALWREERPTWTRQDEFQAQTLELLDTYFRELIYLTGITASQEKLKKGPTKVGPARVSIKHPERPTGNAAAADQASGPPTARPRRRARDPHQRVPARIDPQHAQAFFGRLNGRG